MLRIEVGNESPREIRYSLAGKLSRDYLPELVRLLDEARNAGRQAMLDLAAVTLADRDAVAFFACGPGSGAALERCPSFLREWIRNEVTRENSNGRGEE